MVDQKDKKGKEIPGEMGKTVKTRSEPYSFEDGK